MARGWTGTGKCPRGSLTELLAWMTWRQFRSSSMLPTTKKNLSSSTLVFTKVSNQSLMRTGLLKELLENIFQYWQKTALLGNLLGSLSTTIADPVILRMLLLRKIWERFKILITNLSE